MGSKTSEKIRKESDFAVPLTDGEVPKQLCDRLPGWRQLATEHGYTGPVAWRITEGFAAKAPWGWGASGNGPTKNCVVFWIPRLAIGSTGKDVAGQGVLLAETRLRCGLPDHHLKGFGEAAFLIVLIRAHLKATNERVPQGNFEARTDTFASLEYRMYLSWPEDHLWCASGGYNVVDDNVGVFLFGMEEL